MIGRETGFVRVCEFVASGSGFDRAVSSEREEEVRDVLGLGLCGLGCGLEGVGSCYPGCV